MIATVVVVVHLVCDGHLPDARFVPKGEITLNREFQFDPVSTYVGCFEYGLQVGLPELRVRYLETFIARYGSCSSV